MSRWLVLVGCFLLVDLVAAAEYRASVAWPRIIKLGPAVSGVVSRVHVRVGHPVAKDAPLLSLEPWIFQAHVDSARAELAGAEIGLGEANRELERAEDLFDRALISEHDLELVRIETGKARAIHAKAAAQLQIAELNLRKSVLRSPVAGRVISTDVFPGQYIAVDFVSRPVVTLAEGDILVARAEVDAAVLSGLTEGAKAEVLVGGQVIPGQVFSMGLEPLKTESGTPRYELAVSFAPGRSPPRIGQIVSLRLP